MVIAGVTWFTAGRKHFAGPSGLVLAGVPRPQFEGTQVDEKAEKPESNLE